MTNPIQHIQDIKVLRAIHRMGLHDNDDGSVSLLFEFAPERLPQELSPPLNHLRQLSQAVLRTVVPTVGRQDAIEWDLEFGLAQLNVKYTGDNAVNTRIGWDELRDKIESLRTQHLRN